MQHSIHAAMKDIQDYFTSHNDVPVTRATIRLEEWQFLRAQIDALMIEYCDHEMTPEQIDDWEERQIPV